MRKCSNKRRARVLFGAASLNSEFRLPILVQLLLSYIPALHSSASSRRHPGIQTPLIPLKLYDRNNFFTTFHQGRHGSATNCNLLGSQEVCSKRHASRCLDVYKVANKIRQRANRSVKAKGEEKYRITGANLIPYDVTSTQELL